MWRVSVTNMWRVSVTNMVQERVIVRDIIVRDIAQDIDRGSEQTECETETETETERMRSDGARANAVQLTVL